MGSEGTFFFCLGLSSGAFCTDCDTSQIGMNFETARSDSTILHVFPFNSEKKRGGVAVKRVTFLSLLFSLS